MLAKDDSARWMGAGTKDGTGGCELGQKLGAESSSYSDKRWALSTKCTGNVPVCRTL